MKTVTRIFEFPYFQQEHFPLDKSMVTKSNGEWESVSTAQYLEQANAISRALLTLGVAADAKIAMISMSNRTEWSIVDTGILQVGAQDVAIYPTI